MKIIKASLIALTLAVVPVSASVITGNTLIEKIVDSVVKWKSETMEVGEIPQGIPYTIKFEFTNTTNKPVVISNVKAQCGCTATDYTKEAVLPNKKGFVNATFNAAASGPFTKTVTVTTTDSETPKKLTFKGVVKAK